MSAQRRNSMINIDEWLDKCSADEPDSIIYDPDYINDTASIRTKEKSAELEGLYKVVIDVCTKIGLPPDTVDERLNDIDECIGTFFHTLRKDVQEEYDKLCLYKQDLLNRIQKMTSDLYLPPYVSEDGLTLLHHCKKLKDEFNKLNSVKKKRLSRLQELRDRQTALCQVLGIKTPQISMQTEIPTQDELAKLETAIRDLEEEEKRRKEKYLLLKDMIAKCIDLLEYSPQTDYEQTIITVRPDYSESHLLKMSEFHSKLEVQYEKNQAKYEKLKERLISLYDRLDVPVSERDSFLNTHNACKPTLMAEMEVEIEQYEELKKQNIGKFIDKIKEELVLEYEKCYMPQEQQEAFFSLSSDVSEELLELYEKELERLKKYHEDNREILDRFQKWRMMWKELIDLEVKANDPNRFNNRGGQLLLEEKKRKALQKGLPKVEKDLIDLNTKYSAKKGDKFKIFGTNLDEFIAGCWDELNHAKEEEKRERQRAKMTPKKGTAGRGPQAPVALKRTPAKRAMGNSRFLGALSLSEQEFEDMIVACPASAKRR